MNPLSLCELKPEPCAYADEPTPCWGEVRLEDVVHAGEEDVRIYACRGHEPLLSGKPYQPPPAGNNLVQDVHQRQQVEARRLGWTDLSYNCQTSPDMGRWGGHRARLFGIPPGRDSGHELVPDFFGEVVPMLDANYPNP